MLVDIPPVVVDQAKRFAVQLLQKLGIEKPCANRPAFKPFEDAFVIAIMWGKMHQSTHWQHFDFDCEEDVPSES